MNVLIVLGWLSIGLAIISLIYSGYFIEKGIHHAEREQRPFALAFGSSLALMILQGNDVVMGMVENDHKEFVHILVLQIVVILVQYTVLTFIRAYGYHVRANEL